MTSSSASAAERKQKRLEAWRKRQQQQGKEEGVTATVVGGFQTTSPPPSSSSAAIIAEKPKVKIGLGIAKIRGRKKRNNHNIATRLTPGAALALGDLGDVDEGGEDAAAAAAGKSRAGLLNIEELNGVISLSSSAIVTAPAVQPETAAGDGDVGQQPDVLEPHSKRRRRGRWDVKGINEQDPTLSLTVGVPTASLENNDDVAHSTPTDEGIDDALDTFMMRLEAGDESTTEKTKFNDVADNSNRSRQQSSFIDSSGSMVRMARTSVKADTRAISNVDATAAMSVNKATTANVPAAADYSFSDWESDVPPTPYGSIRPDDDLEPETDDEEEERARRAFIDALKLSAPPPPPSQDDGHASTEAATPNNVDEYETKSEVKSEKERREDAVKQLSLEAERLRKQTHAAIDVGRIYNDDEGGVMDEAERTLAALTAAPDALEVLQEMNKKKELRAVDHKSIDYLPVRKNLYIVPQSLARLTPAEVTERRAKLGVKVRGKGAPAPVSKFSEAGLSGRIMSLLAEKNIVDPFPVQAQCLPCIMAGRDVIGIAKTGSGKFSASNYIYHYEVTFHSILFLDHIMNHDPHRSPFVQNAIQPRQDLGVCPTNVATYIGPAATGKQ